MVETILVVAVGWLILDALIFGLLLLAGSTRERPENPWTDVTADLLAACPYTKAPRRREPGRSRAVLPLRRRA